MGLSLRAKLSKLPLKVCLSFIQLLELLLKCLKLSCEFVLLCLVFIGLHLKGLDLFGHASVFSGCGFFERLQLFGQLVFFCLYLVRLIS